MDPINKKILGAYYTPNYIIEFIVNYVFKEYLKNSNKEDINMKILDPACGDGLFLNKAFAFLKNSLKESISDIEERSLYLLKNNLFGVDIDPIAVESCRSKLLLNINVENQSHINLGNNIFLGNSLIDDPSIGGKNTFVWEEKFKETMNQGGFDIIIGNPPWVSLKGKQRHSEINELVLIYLIEKYKCDKYRPNLFEMFIWQSLKILKNGGYLGFVIPDRLCTNIQFKQIREYILKNAQIKYLWFRPKFEGVISDNLIFIIKKSIPKLKNLILVCEFPREGFDVVQQNLYLKNANYEWFYVEKKTYELFEKIELNKNVVPLSNRFKSSVGFIGKKLAITKEQMSHNQVRIAKGENIQKYLIKNNYYFDFSKDNLLGGTQNFSILSKKNKILLRKTGKNLIAAFDVTGLIPEQSLYLIYNDDPEELIFLSALLNSSLLNCYYHNFAITNRNSTPQLKKSDLDKFPIILSKDDEILQLIRKINILSSQEYKNPLFKDNEIVKTSKMIDKKIYELYDLSSQEIEIIESNRFC